MTIKTWQERTHENQWQSDTTEYMQAEIDELHDELNLINVILEKRKMDWVDYVTQIKAEHKHELANLQKRLDAWEKQEPIGYLAWHAGKPSWDEDCVCQDAVYPVDESDVRTSEPIYTKPKEAT